MSPRTRSVTTDHDVAEQNLRLLTICESGLAGLIEYVAHIVKDAETDFINAAQQAVFDDSARLEAARRKGVVDGLTQIHRRLSVLQTTGR